MRSARTVPISEEQVVAKAFTVCFGDMALVTKGSAGIIKGKSMRNRCVQE
jgi:hypothetical protein